MCIHQGLKDTAAAGLKSFKIGEAIEMNLLEIARQGYDGHSHTFEGDLTKYDMFVLPLEEGKEDKGVDSGKCCRQAVAKAVMKTTYDMAKYRRKHLPKEKSNQSFATHHWSPEELSLGLELSDTELKPYSNFLVDDASATSEDESSGSMLLRFPYKGKPNQMSNDSNGELEHISPGIIAEKVTKQVKNDHNSRH